MMLTIKTPDIYISEPEAIKKLGDISNELISEHDRRVLLVWSKTPKKLLEDEIKDILKSSGFDTAEHLFSGFPTDEQAGVIADTAVKAHSSLIIGVGGGKVMDVTKAAGNALGIPVLCVPTIAATCAAWAAVSIIYTEEGDFKRFLFNPSCPKAIIADTNIIANAPTRYLKSGIVDTLAKWYEPRFDDEGGFVDRISMDTSKLAFDFLLNKGQKVLERIEEGIIDKDTVLAIDAVIFLAGNVGSFIGGEAFSGYAHPFYHSSRRFPETQIRLHGELVAFGLVFQGVLEERPEAEILERIRIFDGFDNAYELSELGLDDEEKISVISRRIITDFKHEDNPQEAEVKKLFDAFYETDRYVKLYKSGSRG